ncbi:TlpA family protein disulfide reductase [Lewinella sp. IMCC34191]|uniref:TlpA family protein disulfide reductase n=1 Tax=Lewinella sp. IMCC34191 TaxID=2259172 RepID=UPI000E25A832|nr:TlpA disulfide reductase family protein [Lewinella sp. IMCC34191]
MHLRILIIALALFPFKDLAAQTVDTPELVQLFAQLSDKSQQIDRVSYGFLNITSENGAADTVRMACAAQRNADNVPGLEFKAYALHWQSGISLAGNELTFYNFTDTTYSQRPVTGEGLEELSGSLLIYLVNRLPFAPGALQASILYGTITEYAIDTTGESIRVEIAYADTEYIQKNRSVYLFDLHTGLFQNTHSTYTDGINQYSREIHYANPQINHAFQDLKQIDALPDTTRWTKAKPPEARPDLAVGDRLPGFSEIVQALELPLPSYDLYLVDMWYFSCAPCQKLSPLIEQLHRQERPGLAVFGLNLFDSPETIAKYQEMKAITFPSFAGRDTREAYAINAFPKVYLLDDQGRILHVTDGYEENFIERITPTIEAYLK